MTITGATTVREIALASPAAVRLMESLRIDYCCGGGKPLSEACAAAGRDLATVLAALEAVQATAPAPGTDWSAARLGELIDYIESRHHGYLRQALPHLGGLADKVAARHGTNHPEVVEAARLYRTLAADLESHLLKEERILFPHVREMELGRGVPDACFATVRGPLSVMYLEHDTAGDLLRELRRATGDYALPEDACGSYQALYAGLRELEADLHAHIHLENNVLFPRAVEMEEALS